MKYNVGDIFVSCNKGSVRYIDSNKINKVLGWEPKTELSVGLKKAYDWYLTNREEFN